MTTFPSVANPHFVRNHPHFSAKTQIFILDSLYRALPRPPFTDEGTEEVAARVYNYVWQRSASGNEFATSH